VTTRTATPRAAARRVPAWVWLAVAGLALLVYAVGYDQGLLLEPLFGKAATADKHLHELFHDGRHLLGFPCH
jgi:Probable cobalt transporter subunit (CbtB)